MGQCQFAMPKELLVNNTSPKSNNVCCHNCWSIFVHTTFVWRCERGWLKKFVNLCYESHLHKVSMEMFSNLQHSIKAEIKISKNRVCSIFWC
jgi:hypothetical protein